MTVRSFYSCPFHCKPRPSGVSLEFTGLENISKVPGNRAEVGEDHDARKAVSNILSVLKVKLGYTSALKLESERAVVSPVSTSLQTKAIRS